MSDTINNNSSKITDREKILLRLLGIFSVPIMLLVLGYSFAMGFFAGLNTNFYYLISIEDGFQLIWLLFYTTIQIIYAVGLVGFFVPLTTILIIMPRDAKDDNSIARFLNRINIKLGLDKFDRFTQFAVGLVSILLIYIAYNINSLKESKITTEASDF